LLAQSLEQPTSVQPGTFHQLVKCFPFIYDPAVLDKSIEGGKVENLIDETESIFNVVFLHPVLYWGAAIQYLADISIPLLCEKSLLMTALGHRVPSWALHFQWKASFEIFIGSDHRIEADSFCHRVTRLYWNFRFE